jgi:hypothetical protein
MVERQGEGEITLGAGAPLIHVFIERYGRPTIVLMADGTEFTVYDGIAWGRDYGDLWEHVTAQIVPLGTKIHEGDLVFFYMSDVQALLDPDTGEVLASQVPSPGET